MLARGTYEVGTDNVEKPVELRRFNELVHRIANFQRKVAKPQDHQMSDAVFFELLDDHLAALGISRPTLLSVLSNSSRTHHGWRH